MLGYTGKIARINLSNGTINEYPITERDREMFLGKHLLQKSSLTLLRAD